MSTTAREPSRFSPRSARSIWSESPHHHRRTKTLLARAARGAAVAFGTSIDWKSTGSTDNWEIRLPRECVLPDALIVGDESELDNSSIRPRSIAVRTSASRVERAWFQAESASPPMTARSAPQVPRACQPAWSVANTPSLAIGGSRRSALQHPDLGRSPLDIATIEPGQECLLCRSIRATPLPKSCQEELVSFVDHPRPQPHPILGREPRDARRGEFRRRNQLARSHGFMIPKKQLPLHASPWAIH